LPPFNPDEDDPSHKEIGVDTDDLVNPEDENTEAEEDEQADVEKYLGLMEKFFYKIQSSEDHLESAIVGLIICFSGLSLCFLGSFLIKLFLSMMCIFSLDLLMIQIVLFIFNETHESETGLLLIVAISLMSIPLGIKAGEVANAYAVPIICGVNLMSLMDIALQIFEVKN
jgi:hypothetical protein